MRKKGFEMNFTWIFAIIVGVIILFLAIYAASQFIKTRRYEIDIETSAKLAILLDPLETSLEAGKSYVLGFNSETRIYNDKCYTYGSFGEQSIGVTMKSGVRGEWQDPAYAKPLHNKYIFSNNLEQGKEFSVFSKPFKMPFKVADLIFFSGQEYCFIQAPTEIKDELQGLNIKNAYFTEVWTNCSEQSEKVCFFRSDCDIGVYGEDYSFEAGYVIKESRTVYYEGPLIYGAIFSSPEVYECNVKRLMSRLVNLCFVYKDKIEILEGKGCGSLLDTHFNELVNLAGNAETSSRLDDIAAKAQEIDIINNAAICKVF